MLLIFFVRQIMKKFKKIYIEITNRCNLSCSFCPKHKRELRAMTAEEFEAVLDKVHKHGENFYLHLMGEPLGHPQFEQILQLCSRYGVKTNITTNGTLLKRTADTIVNAEVRSVCVSLHSFEANDLNVSLHSYLADITSFCKKALGHKTAVELRLWNMSRQSLQDKDNLNFKIVDFIKKELQTDCDVEALIENTFFAMEKNRKKNFRLKDNIFLGMAEQFAWPDITQSPNAVCKGFCYGLRNQIAILADGTVVPCCLDSDGNMPLGNIFESSLEEIYLSPRSQAIYNGFTNMKAVDPLCQSCGYMKKYMELSGK